MKRPLAYITAAWSENEIENTETAAKYCRAIYEAGFAPVCPLLHLPLYLNDEIPKEHKDGRCAVVSAPDRNYRGVCGRGAPHGGGSVTLPHGPPPNAVSRPIPSESRRGTRGGQRPRP